MSKLNDAIQKAGKGTVDDAVKKAKAGVDNIKVDAPPVPPLQSQSLDDAFIASKFDVDSQMSSGIDSSNDVFIDSIVKEKSDDIITRIKNGEKGKLRRDAGIMSKDEEKARKMGAKIRQSIQGKEAVEESSNPLANLIEEEVRIHINAKKKNIIPILNEKLPKNGTAKWNENDTLEVMEGLLHKYNQTVVGKKGSGKPQLDALDLKLSSISDTPKDTYAKIYKSVTDFNVKGGRKVEVESALHQMYQTVKYAEIAKEKIGGVVNDIRKLTDNVVNDLSVYDKDSAMSNVAKKFVGRYLQEFNGPTFDDKLFMRIGKDFDLPITGEVMDTVGQKLVSIQHKMDDAYSVVNDIANARVGGNGKSGFRNLETGQPNGEYKIDLERPMKNLPDPHKRLTKVFNESDVEIMKSVNGDVEISNDMMRKHLEENFASMENGSIESFGGDLNRDLKVALFSNLESRTRKIKQILKLRGEDSIGIALDNSLKSLRNAQNHVKVSSVNVSGTNKLVRSAKWVQQKGTRLWNSFYGLGISFALGSPKFVAMNSMQLMATMGSDFFRLAKPIFTNLMTTTTNTGLIFKDLMVAGLDVIHMRGPLSKGKKWTAKQIEKHMSKNVSDFLLNNQYLSSDSAIIKFAQSEITTPKDIDKLFTSNLQSKLAYNGLNKYLKTSNAIVDQNIVKKQMTELLGDIDVFNRVISESGIKGTGKEGGFSISPVEWSAKSMDFAGSIKNVFYKGSDLGARVIGARLYSNLYTNIIRNNAEKYLQTLTDNAGRLSPEQHINLRATYVNDVMQQLGTKKYDGIAEMQMRAYIEDSISEGALNPQMVVDGTEHFIDCALDMNFFTYNGYNRPAVLSGTKNVPVLSKLGLGLFTSWGFYSSKTIETKTIGKTFRTVTPEATKAHADLTGKLDYTRIAEDHIEHRPEMLASMGWIRKKSRKFGITSDTDLNRFIMTHNVDEANKFFNKSGDDAIKFEDWQLAKSYAEGIYSGRTTLGYIAQTAGAGVAMYYLGTTIINLLPSYSRGVEILSEGKKKLRDSEYVLKRQPGVGTVKGGIDLATGSNSSPLFSLGLAPIVETFMYGYGVTNAYIGDLDPSTFNVHKYEKAKMIFRKDINKFLDKHVIITSGSELYQNVTKILNVLGVEHDAGKLKIRFEEDWGLDAYIDKK